MLGVFSFLKSYYILLYLWNFFILKRLLHTGLFFSKGLTSSLQRHVRFIEIRIFIITHCLFFLLKLLKKLVSIYFLVQCNFIKLGAFLEMLLWYKICFFHQTFFMKWSIRFKVAFLYFWRQLFFLLKLKILLFLGWFTKFLCKLFIKYILLI